jgi:hypothetical protein
MHPFPDPHDVAACGVNDLTATRLDSFQPRDFRAEGRNDHHVFRPQVVNVVIAIRRKKIFDSQHGKLLINLGIMNDLAQDINSVVLENSVRCVG